MRNKYTKEYLTLLNKRRFSLGAKRAFDIVVSLLILAVCSPFFLLLALAVKIDSRGPVFYRQVRVGRYNQDFKIFKFRTMVQDADKIGPPLTVGDDPRVTKVGRFIRKLRLDEFSQLLNVLGGSMSLVGPRPEVRKYVDVYAPEYMATLLIRPGITATSSIAFKDEDSLLNAAEDPEKVYVEQILPPKMAYNLEYMKNISLLNDIKIMFRTVGAVLK
ncbi:sugar transferase [Caproiciproducens sp. CPB-2]|jgi:Sugar transferases involved in lipopolysaccharide synthesis|nr:sugar transferase [Caproiciproducens sp. CPB-2]MBE6829805.1 sugar transferase [Oscillospiraceae bacterium]MDF1494172.1 sugar transferase [Caproiciproducens sp. CPB-2]